MEEIVALIARAQTGDSEAYGVLVSRFQDMAYGYAYAILSDFHLAQDAAQEAFIEAYQCLPSLREEFAFPAWLKRIVHKHCDRLTRRKRLATAPLETVTEVASPQPGPAEMAERRELAQRVQDAIRELPDQQRVVTTLFYINGYSHQDIAEFLEVPAKTVKSRLHASRSRLRERMIDMVHDELKANALPEEFTKETVEQAVVRAKALNKDSKHIEAEELMREVLTKAPEHPGALRELNRALAQGRVYPQGRFDLLPELAEYGKTILQAFDDDYTYAQLARTLLTIPAMPEAVAFLSGWIAQKGPNVERLGMLAWAKGCLADYEEAEKLWQEVLALARSAEPDDILREIPFIAFTLVDCFAEAGELPRAQRVARQAWDLCLERVGDRRLDWSNADGDWITIFRMAQLDLREVVQGLLAHRPTDAGLRTRGEALGTRSWVEGPQAIASEWLDWVRECIAAEEWRMPMDLFSAVRGGIGSRGEWRMGNQLAEATWELLQKAAPEIEEQRGFWVRQCSIAWDAIMAGDWDAAEEFTRRGIRECGGPAGNNRLMLMAVMRGTPTPPEVLEQLYMKDADSYGLDWYAVAREAATAGDEAKAFDALRKALSYWTNQPYYLAKLWEKDEYWGELRSHPEFTAAFDERRKRIGPIYGLLHYFPGW